MANPLDSAINQHLMSWKAGQAPSVAAQHLGMMAAPAFPAPPTMMPGMFAGLPGAPPPPMVGMPPGAQVRPGTTGPFPMGMGMMMMAPTAAPPRAAPPPAAPTPSTGQLSMVLDNLPFRYQLVEHDLRETFERWGPIKSLQVSRGGIRDVGIINFEDPSDAADAKRQLHGFTFAADGASGAMNVSFGGPEQFGASMPPMGPVATATAAPQTALGQVVAPAPAAPAPAAAEGMLQQQHPQHGDGQQQPAATAAPAMPELQPAPRPAWCCKVIIQAEKLHPEFPTKSKILGADDANVEHIRSQTQCAVHLRGRGSGFIEANGIELQEPMFLWMASVDANAGQQGMDITQDLLQAVYVEHNHWCAEHDQKVQSVTEAIVIRNPVDLPPAMPQRREGFGPSPVEQLAAGQLHQQMAAPMHPMVQAH